jgi:hypothetical protein
VSRPRGLLQTIIASAVERLAAHPAIPPDRRDAFRAQAVRVFEQQINAVVGCDRLVVSGWAMPPSARQDRRDRIEAALRRGEAVKAIAGRELVSQRLVFKVKAELAAAELLPPEQFSGGRAE